MTDPLNDLTNWLISEGRVLGDGEAVVREYSHRLVAAGVPLSRVNIAQRFANPLLAAWGVIWTPGGIEQYDVTHAMLDTASYVGSSFEYVLEHRRPLHKSLAGLNPDTEHGSYLEMAEAGGTDLFATLLEYGDGSRHGCTFITNDPLGFSEQHLELIQQSTVGLSCAMEPITMRKSTGSLLRTYLGNGPADAVNNGTIHRGDQTSLDAVVMITDLRGFTAKSESWSETALLAALNGYFDTVVNAVDNNGGDVLKFMGDGILAIFPIDAQHSREDQCLNTVAAARSALAGLDELNTQRQLNGEEALEMGVGINVGPVTYGNIGSPDRLDFTVLGSAVNVASRVQDLCKSIGKTVLATQSVASCSPDQFESMDSHPVRGFAEPLKIFALQV
ncbi:MAG: adenylate/guanylate cyclase domain-containing protein [Rhizobiaceae bacterium]